MKKKWSVQKSIILSRIIVYLFTVILFVMDVTGWLIAEKLDQVHMPLLNEHKGLCFMICLYGCSIPAYIVLYNLHRLLMNISADKVFVPENVNHLRQISWCMFIAMAICLSCCLNLPFVVVVVAAAGFIGLIVRIIKNVFERAIQMKEELDLTI